MNTKDFIRRGVPLGEGTRRATDFVIKFILGSGDKATLRAEVMAVVKGKLSAARLGRGKIVREKLLYDFNDMKFEALAAPY